jgi:hypothetical protein
MAAAIFSLLIPAVAYMHGSAEEDAISANAVTNSPPEASTPVKTSGTKCRLRSQLLAQLWQQTPPWNAALQCSSGSSKLTHSAANSKLEFLLLNSRSFSPQPKAWLHASCEADPALKYSWLPKPKREEQKQSREGED